MSKKFVCWRCGESLKEIARPFPRLEKCRTCGADLHVCLMCHFYNPRMNDHCDHELAEPAREADLANFCQYLKLKPGAFTKAMDKAKQAEAELKALFGEKEDATAKPVTETAQKTPDSIDPLRALFQDETADNNKNK